MRMLEWEVTEGEELSLRYWQSARLKRSSRPGGLKTGRNWPYLKKNNHINTKGRMKFTHLDPVSDLFFLSSPTFLFIYSQSNDLLLLCSNKQKSAEEDTVEVKKHIQRMSSATCGIPAVRLIYVHEQHEPAPNVRYLPSCTWLHRCSDDIGCCLDSSKTCSASNIESVSLPFFVRILILYLSLLS